jgi:hypothetical protein
VLSVGWQRRRTLAGPDFGLGLEARSRAQPGRGAAAESCYREAVDRLGRAGLRPELAPPTYGEWLRRDRRRVEVRVQLRAAHDLLGALRMAAFAERARRELAATGETVR